MYFFSSKLYFRVLSVCLLTVVFVGLNQTAYSQKTKPKPEKKSASSKTIVKKPVAKTAKKETASKKTSSKTKAASTNLKTPAKNESRAEAVKKRAAQQAVLEERRRREQAVRAAQAKKQALENSFRAETAKNIANDDINGEDMEVRRAALNALGTRAGTVVVMEAQTGKIVSIVNQEWAIRESFKPCSTIKLVTAVAGSDQDLIDGDGGVRNKKVDLNLTDALAYSNNSYFQAVGSNLGSEMMITYAKRLGLGQPTGINAESEVSGKLPYGNNNLRIYSHGDDYQVTPLQLGVMVSAISNGGKVVVPQIVRSKVQKTSFRGYMRRTIDLPKKNLQSVIPGMIGAAEYGTARRGVDSSMGVAGKTGSCIEKGTWIGLFASVAPVVNPEYAVIVITRGQNERGKYAAAIAGNIYQVLAKRMDKTNLNQARVPLILKPQPKVNAKKSAELDSGEDQDSDDTDTDSPVSLSAVKERQKVGKKPTAKPRELFPPIVIKVKDPTSRPRVVN